MGETTTKGGATQRQDGYANILNKYGTPQDNATAYRFRSDGLVPDIALTLHYEENGLFAKIIDIPAEEAVNHGFTLTTEAPDAEDVLFDTLDALEWSEKAATAIKWARLFGGAIIVMLIDDGGGLNDPLNRDAIKGIDGLKVYERAVVQPDWETTKYGDPQCYQVSSISGYFTVHASRCLVFKNGVLPEHTINTQYRFWGLPEYVRIKKELRECSTSHGLGVKLLDRSVQAIYSMKGLADSLLTDAGEDAVMKRLQLIDRARGILNSIAIDADGENYDFKSVTFAGVKDIIDTTCNMLSAVTSIPQTILFGRSPAGENSTGDSDLENFYNLCERIQKVMLYGNLKRLVDIIFCAAHARGDIEEKPVAKVKFNPLWSLSETDQATIEQARATASQTKAQTAQLYIDMGALDPSEVRRGLAENKEFNIEKLLDDIPEQDLMTGWDDPALANLETDESNLKDSKSNFTNYRSDVIIRASKNTNNNACADDDECKAEDLSTCPYHGNSSSSKAEEQLRRTISGVLLKVTTSNGIRITAIRDHAFKRIIERGYGASHLKHVLETAESTEGKWKGSRVYEKRDLRIIVNENTGEIVSVIRLKKKGGHKK